ncbi:MAG: tetratricopeptide repeat protein [Archangium sp.]|nr:tetratricopeptide repeat protein [Archangium sp.]
MADAAPNAPADAGLNARLQQWADGKVTLRDVRGYTADELFAIARTGYFFFYQGRVEQARTVFQGLYAIDPTEPYFAKALGVVEMASGNPQGALSAYDVALKLDPRDAAAYVGRAEVRLAQGQRSAAVEDLRRAVPLAQESALKSKASALLEAISKK